MSYGAFLRRYALFILALVCGGTGLSAWVLWQVVTPVYQASVSVLILEPRSTGLSHLVSRLESQLDMAGPLGSLSLPGMQGSSEADLISILRSRTLAEQVAAQINLRQLPEVQELLAEPNLMAPERQIVEFLQRKLKILPPDGQDGTLRVRMRLSDPVLASQIANTYVKTLQSYVGKMIDRDQNRQVDYLNQQSAQLAQQLQESETALLRYQQRNRTLALDVETKQLIESLAGLEANEISARAALADAQARQRSFVDSAQSLAPESPVVGNELDRNVAGLQERQAALSQAQTRYQQRLAQLPQQGLELARLERQVTLNNRLYLLVHQQAQAARLDAAQSPELFRILDPALPPLKPVYPAKGLALAISVIMLVGLGIGLSGLHQAWTRRQEAWPDVEVV